MADLWGGLASGIDKGLDAYRQQNQINVDNKRKDLAQKISAAQGGFTYDDQGNVSRTPEGQAELDSKTAEAQRQKDAYDPNSDYSQRTRDFTRGLLKASGTGFDSAITDNMTAADIKDASDKGLLGTGVKGYYGMQGRMLTSDRIGESNDIKRQGLDLRKQNQAIQAASVYDNDPILKSNDQRLQSVGIAKHTLENNQKITPQMLEEIQTDVARAIAGGSSSGVGEREATKFHSVQQDFTNLMQRITNKPEDVDSPEVKQYLHGVLVRLEDAYGGIRQKRAQDISVGRNYDLNPMAAKAQQQKLQSFAPQTPSLIAGLLQPQAPGPQGLVIPKQGDVQEGYQFLGGNPSDPKSWKKAQ